MDGRGFRVGTSSWLKMVGFWGALSAGLCAAPAPAADVQPYSVQLKGTAFEIAPGTHIGAVEIQSDCTFNRELLWQGDAQAESLVSGFNSAFTEVLKADNYPVVEDRRGIFDEQNQQNVQFQVAAVVDSMSLIACYPYVAIRDLDTVRGDAFLHVTWQLYSSVDHKVVYQAAYTGSYKAEGDKMRAPEALLQKAFADAAHRFFDDPEVKDFLTPKQASIGPDHSPGIYTDPVIIPELKRSKSELGKHLDAVRAAVVTIITNDGTGSGVVISKDGYILTDAHVVGKSDFVKVKLVSGEELTGMVLRWDRKRDVALVEVTAFDMSALPIRASDPKLGEDVYALGSSLGIYESTLTKGIVSAFREHDGNKYIQSDVNVQHGNSGGALLDADGNLIGLTESGVVISGAPAGINFFNPILDCLGSLDILIK